MDNEEEEEEETLMVELHCVWLSLRAELLGGGGGDTDGG